MRTLANERGTFNDNDFESVPFGNGDAEHHGVSAGVDDADLTPTDTGSDDDRLAELAAIEAEREMNSLWCELAASRARVLAQATGADEVAVRAEPTFDRSGRRLDYWVFIHFAGKVYCGHSEDLPSAEMQALLAASPAAVAAKRAGKVQVTA